MSELGNRFVKRGRLSMSALRRKRRLDLRKPINVVASLVTLVNLYCGVSAIFAAIEGQFEKAAYFILASIGVDMIDGIVARLTKSVSEFGKQLDSLCDVVSFGAAPAALIYTVYLPGERDAILRIGAALAIIYAACTALRLARFNVYQAEIREYFVGLPSPAAAATVASFVLFTTYFEFQITSWTMWLMLGGSFTLLSYLMVSHVQYPKGRIKNWLLAPPPGFKFLALCAVAIAVFDLASRRSPALVFFPLAAAYCLFGIVDTGYRRYARVFGKARGAAQPDAAPPSGSPPSKMGDVL